MPDKIIGLSIKNEEEFQQSKVEYVDYVGVGPVFDTQSKDDAWWCIGYEGLKWWENMPQMPLVAMVGYRRNILKTLWRLIWMVFQSFQQYRMQKNIEKTVREMSEQ